MNNEPQTDRAVDLWRAIVQTERLVEFFTGLFDVIGITIEETGEELTARIEENQIHIDPGLPDNYDFLVPLKLENVHNMVSHAADGKLDEFEVWRIVAVLFTLPYPRNPYQSRYVQESTAETGRNRGPDPCSASRPRSRACRQSYPYLCQQPVVGT